MSGVIENLPVELLQDVFLVYAEGGSPVNAQVLYSVCREWKSIALHTPDLWTNVSIIPTNAFPPIPLLERWLERSRDSPLCIKIGTYNEGDRRTGLELVDRRQEYYLADVLGILGSQCYRWRSFTLCIESYLAHLCHDIPMEGAAMLKVVDLEIDRWGEEEESIAFNMTARVPALKSLRMHARNHQVAGLPEPIGSWPWKALSRLELDWSRGWEVVAQVIPLCTSAVWIKLYSWVATTNTRKFPNRTYLPNLRGLILSGWGWDMLEWSHSLDCPNLSILHISLHMSYNMEYGLLPTPGDPYDPLARFLGSKRHNIYWLKMDLVVEDLRMMDLFKVLKSCLVRGIPSVGFTLDCNAINNTEEFIGEVYLAQYRDPSFSKLQFLDDFGDEQFMRMGWGDNKVQSVDAILEGCDGISRLDLADIMPNLRLG
ncbi:hypothetical protein P691DRAFT_813275 [Macrolepiota fuliginosa MF-IS2]|uniref:F-box domain-containing protein n=1 Tax=Macrolepiota fuliginosa MF-IS2 TaxID=1400762 RepID=A0A9P5X0C8_9AGAR|nr:hypothetical protein P691DRAFT_813275 [Macrolepiota fuliginosa MF-IS2]